MNKSVINFTALVIFLITGNVLFAQETTSPYQFTVIKNMDVTETEDQCASGTCWSFATVSFVEAEIIRKGHAPVDISEMFNVRMTYPKKAESFVRYQGKQQFGPGGLSHDVLNIVNEFGLVPEQVYSGLNPGKDKHNHGALDNMLESAVKNALDKKMNEESSDWMIAINSILDGYLGRAPENFEYGGKKYTPKSFRDAMSIKADEYVSVTSFSHHPYYSKFVLEVPDNWAKGEFHNIPLDDFQQLVDGALERGYTIAWDADVSEKGFSFKNGLALVPDETVAKDDYFKKVVPEKVINQANRQEGFDTFKTTDDHLMHITGVAKDQAGNKYYITKNSWGSGNQYKGFQYVSKSYLQYKTIGIMIHKDAIPQDLKVKMGI